MQHLQKDVWDQIAEIYDGECPAESRGCFAQAWSVAELLRAYEDAETAVDFWEEHMTKKRTCA